MGIDANLLSAKHIVFSTRPRARSHQQTHYLAVAFLLSGIGARNLIASCISLNSLQLLQFGSEQ